ncbi:TPA: DUF3742 family protein [Pseudomonas aeruginosa]|uniref:DUF3742 family protein n=1 Tax=Pseudomonas aeruginosa TaxID=287 RepID=UPI0004F2C9E3|nr:DUF3742 family protein [Pseudomonas aeruginosa]EKT9493059.1 DUF3742 family protein [Pseudomonas aeruginosa]MBH4028426.1 DUF3742 family protein [Pseudomonas aeruginosa]MBV5530604.1 DUF3742 family protein [Pseudomonas aeruginosa]MCS8095355.1 DUF3742 family protein [Pseudomonas aeruginosa]RTS98451.1 DUF3742 family protein [Pseudomonas aeruginosa]
MNTTTRSSTAERFGRRLGRAWRAYLRRERRVVAWLVSVGAPTGVATVLVWAVKLAVLGVFFYVAVWLALLLLFAVAVAWSAGRGDTSEEDEWPFARQDDIREMPWYDPVPYNDTAHPDFPDEKDL